GHTPTENTFWTVRRGSSACLPRGTGKREGGWGVWGVGNWGLWFPPPRARPVQRPDAHYAGLTNVSRGPWSGLDSHPLPVAIQSARTEQSWNVRLYLVVPVPSHCS